MGIYKNIFNAITGKNKDKPRKQKKVKSKKNKPMTKAEKEARKLRLRNKTRNLIKKGGDFIVSGKAQTGAALVTRYAQGKPVVIKRTSAPENVPDTFQIFGYPVKKTYVYVGGTLAVLGIAYAATRTRK